MPGASGDPVRFANPFQRITEVGWDTVTHIAFYVTIQELFVDGSSQNYPPDPGLGHRPVIPSGDWMTTWSQVINNEGTLSISLSYAPGTQPQGKHVYRKKAGWGLAPENFELPGGLPNMTGSSAWNVLAHTRNSAFGPISDSPWALTAGGDGDGMHIPGQPSLPFAYDVSPRYYRYDNAVYTESPYWASGPGLSVAFGAYTAAAEIALIDKTFAGSGLTALYKGRAYRACAAAVSNPSPNHYPLWVLLKRSESDDPSE